MNMGGVVGGETESADGFGSCMAWGDKFLGERRGLRYPDNSNPYAQKESCRAMPCTIQRHVRSRSRRPRIHALERFTIIDVMAFCDPGGAQAFHGGPVLHVLRREEFLPPSLVMSDDDISAFCPPVVLFGSS